MKKVMIVILLLLGSRVQAENNVYLRLGMTFQEVLKEIPDAKRDSLSEGKVLIQETKTVRVFYFFYKEDKCEAQAYLYNISSFPSILKNFSEDSKYIKTDSLEFMYVDKLETRVYSFLVNNKNETVTLYVENL